MEFSRKNAVDPTLLARAREMRKDPAPPEEKLWRCLRDRQLNGFKFRRQHNVGSFIADFYCHETRLVVEADGDSHASRQQYDRARTVRLEQDGYHVIRFENADVLDHLDAVLEEILKECESLRTRRSR